MNKKLKAIYHRFNGRLVGSSNLKLQVCRVVSLLSIDMADYIVDHCWFVGSMKDAWAYTFTGNDLKDQHLIFLSDYLFFQPEGQVQWTLMHEIGHVMLGHRNSVETTQTQREIDDQEQEADEFAKKYLSYL